MGTRSPSSVVLAPNSLISQLFNNNFSGSIQLKREKCKILVLTTDAKDDVMYNNDMNA